MKPRLGPTFFELFALWVDIAFYSSKYKIVFLTALAIQNVICSFIVLNFLFFFFFFSFVRNVK